MGVAVLGPLEIDGHANGVSPRDRVVLSALVVGGGHPVSVDALADSLWGQELPASWAKVVQGCVVRLRKALGAAAIDSSSSGYRLTLNDDEVDLRRFERLLQRGSEALDADDPGRASHLVSEALDLWRGNPLADLEDWEPGQVEAARLDGLRMDAEELLVQAEMRAGHARATLERARTLVAQAPYRERRWVLLATALHQTGRQAEALAAVTRARRMLATELGIDPGHELVALESLLLRQDPSLRPPEERTTSALCPYRGLLPYGADDADAFFGREDDVAACLRRLRDTHVLAVVGPSGVGKSSLVLAGVVAALTRVGSPVLVTAPGSRPVESLDGLKPGGRQTLVVDQAEEAVTACRDAAERAQYFAALASHVGAGGSLVLSLRADHVGDLASYPDIARILEAGLYLLGPMGRAELRSAVEGPAHRAGLRLEPGLVDLLVLELEGEPAALPLLSHVLRETWERREGPTLTVAGYQATGGIRHAVAHSAESLYDSLEPAQRDRLRHLLLRLVVPSEGGEAVPVRVPRAKITADEAHLRLVEQLIGARLVSIDGDTVQIAHEALVRVWPRLRGWLEDDVEGQRLFRHLAGAAEAWEAMSRPGSELYRGSRLTRTLDWQHRAQPDLSESESAFLEASAAASTSELHAAQQRIRLERRVNRRLRGALAGVAVLSVLALLVGAVALGAAQRADDERNRAGAAADLADARRAAVVAHEHPDLSFSLLLAVAALEVDTSAQTWETLASVLMRSPALLSVGNAGGFVTDQTASPDGTMLAVSRLEGLLLLDGETLLPLPFADDTPSSGVAFAPDSRTLALAVNQWQGTNAGPRIDPQPIRLYDMPQGTLADRQLGGFPPDGGSVEYALDFSADGRRLVAAVDVYDPVTRDLEPGSAATVWDLADPSAPLFQVGVPIDPILKLSPDGTRLYVAVTGPTPKRDIRAYDVDSGRLLDTNTSASLNGIGQRAGALRPDGSTLALGAGSSVLRVDTGTLNPVGPALRSDDGDSVERVEYSPDGSRLAAVTAKGTIVVWDADTGVELHRFENGHLPMGFSFSSDGETIHSAGEQLKRWDLTGHHAMFAVGSATKPGDFTESLAAPDGHTLVREQGGLLWFVDDDTGRQTPRVPTSTRVAYHGWSPDSRWLWRSDRGLLEVWESATARLVAQRELTGTVAMAAFSHASDRVYVTLREEGVLLVLDRATLEPVGAPIELGALATGFAPDPDGQSVWVVAQDGAVRSVLPGSGEVEQVAPPGTFEWGTYDVDISPDGARALGSVGESAVQLFDTTTWAPMGPAAGRTEHDGTYDLSPDGLQFAALVADEIALYDGSTGARQATITLPDATSTTRIRYLPDSKGLLVTDQAGRTWTVDTRREAWVSRACGLAGRNLSQAEWREYFPGRTYEATCPQWPAGG